MGFNPRMAVDSHDPASDGDSASPQPATAFEWVGGEGAVRSLVDRFYDLMDLEPAYAGIRAFHPQDMAESRNKLFWFLCGWLGGPSLYVERFGHPRLRARHLPYAIGLSERDQWMACMVQAMREQGLPDTLVERLVESFHNTADWMRNKGG